MALYTCIQLVYKLRDQMASQSWNQRFRDTRERWTVGQGKHQGVCVRDRGPGREGGGLWRGCWFAAACIYAEQLHHPPHPLTLYTPHIRPPSSLLLLRLVFALPSSSTSSRVEGLMDSPGHALPATGEARSSNGAQTSSVRRLMVELRRDCTTSPEEPCLRPAFQWIRDDRGSRTLADRSLDGLFLFTRQGSNLGYNVMSPVVRLGAVEVNRSSHQPRFLSLDRVRELARHVCRDLRRAASKRELSKSRKIKPPCPLCRRQLMSLACSIGAPSHTRSA